ncbi:MAG: addiction module protein [Candidatus Latescibacterota bacterium]
MGAIAEDLESAAMQLPRAERARLAERLIASLDEDVEIEQTWAEEVRRGVEELCSGAVQSIAGEQVFAEIKHVLR